MQGCDHYKMEKSLLTLAERLIDARESKGWKKSDLRREAGLKSPSTLTELEDGSRTESPQLPKIAKALGVEVLWLQFGELPRCRDDTASNVTGAINDEEMKIIEAYRGGGQEIREIFIRLAKLSDNLLLSPDSQVTNMTAKSTPQRRAWTPPGEVENSERLDEEKSPHKRAEGGN